MRERATPSDILRVLWVLEELWLKYPEQRLGQILLNLTRASDGSVDATRLWNADEDALDDRAAEVIERGWGAS